MKVAGPMKEELFADYQRLTNMRVRRCHAPGEECTSSAVSAHSIQRSRFLSLLAEDGHLLQIKLQAKSPKEGLHLLFKRVGINKASTFTGLCGKHDDEMFAEIEKGEIDFDDPRHLFLLAYRSTLHEFHVQIEGAKKIQTEYDYRVEEGLDDPNQATPVQVLADQLAWAAYKTYRYKTFLDEAFLGSNTGVLAHNIVRLQTMLPTLAASSLYPVDGVGIHLNVLPISKGETVAIFSYLAEVGRRARRHLRPILTNRVDEVPRNLSRFILERCSNLFFAPFYVDSWSAPKKDAVMQYFDPTIAGPDVRRSPHWDLFIVRERDKNEAKSGQNARLDNYPADQSSGKCALTHRN